MSTCCYPSYLTSSHTLHLSLPLPHTSPHTLHLSSQARQGSQHKDDTSMAAEPRVYEHNLVRTDSRLQTLNAFLAPARPPPSTSLSSSLSSSSHNLSASMPPPKRHFNDTPKMAGGALVSNGVVGVEDGAEDEWDPIRMKPKKKQKKQGCCAACCHLFSV